jgi:hypothetical protein
MKSSDSTVSHSWKKRTRRRITMLPSNLVSTVVAFWSDADDSRACHEEGSDIHESIGYASAGNQCVSQFSALGVTNR